MTEYQEQADRLERAADDMAQQSERLGDEIADVRADWERKRADDSVPGTPPVPKGEDGEDSSDDEASSHDE
jgi:hypothetical protein